MRKRHIFESFDHPDPTISDVWGPESGVSLAYHGPRRAPLADPLRIDPHLEFSTSDLYNLPPSPYAFSKIGHLRNIPKTIEKRKSELNDSQSTKRTKEADIIDNQDSQISFDVTDEELHQIEGLSRVEDEIRDQKTADNERSEEARNVEGKEDSLSSKVDIDSSEPRNQNENSNDNAKQEEKDSGSYGAEEEESRRSISEISTNLEDRTSGDLSDERKEEESSDECKDNVVTHTASDQKVDIITRSEGINQEDDFIKVEKDVYEAERAASDGGMPKKVTELARPISRFVDKLCGEADDNRRQIGVLFDIADFIAGEQLRRVVISTQ